jgi:hypothetical protein
MSRRLLIVNVLLGIVSVALATGIVRTLVVKRSLPLPAAARVASAPPPATASTSADPGLSTYSVIAARNLFNPARSETAATAAAPVSKPILHGVVLDGAKSRAFLEDPGVKRVAGYSVGDAISGGRIQRITDDRVVIARPEGLLEVLLQDPGKPRPAPTSGAPGSPALPSPQTAPGAQAPQGPQVPTVGQAAPPAGQVAPPQGPVIGAPPSGPTAPPLRRRLPQPGND